MPTRTFFFKLQTTATRRLDTIVLVNAALCCVSARPVVLRTQDQECLPEHPSLLTAAEGHQLERKWPNGRTVARPRRLGARASASVLGTRIVVAVEGGLGTWYVGYARVTRAGVAELMLLRKVGLVYAVFFHDFGQEEHVFMPVRAI